MLCRELLPWVATPYTIAGLSVGAYILNRGFSSIEYQTSLFGRRVWVGMVIIALAIVFGLFWPLALVFNMITDSL